MTVIEDRTIANGEMQDTKERLLADGSLLTFEYAPMGWPTKTGAPRQKEWRAYHLQRPGEKRERLTSVSTLLDLIIPKGALVPWAEERGIQGAVLAMQKGLLDPFGDPLDAVHAVRSNGLGADAARDEGATRGLRVHTVPEEYMLTGKVPNLGDFDPAHRGFVQGAAKWLLEQQVEPISIEEIVCDAEHGFAGRVDLVARINDRVTVVDFKTSAKSNVYDRAHVQAALYARAYTACGGEQIDDTLIVGFNADGTYTQMPGACSEKAALAALTWGKYLKPITSACDSVNRARRKAAA